MTADALSRLCELCGLQAEYTDIWGQVHRASSDTQRAVLTAMGIDISDSASLERAIDEFEFRSWRSLIPCVQVIRDAHSPICIPLSIPATHSNSTFNWLLTDEQGKR